MSYTQRTQINNAKYFNKLSAKVKDAVEQVVIDRGQKMLDILRHRKIMENVGGSLSRWPKWDGSNGVSSKESYSWWEGRFSANGVFTIISSPPQSEIEDFNYPRALARGFDRFQTKNGAFNVKPTGAKLTIGSDGHLYSTQMPNGMTPWLMLQKEYMKEDVLNEIKRLGLK
jgi:hypothetical protein